MLTEQEIHIILDLIAEKHGPGYSDDAEVCALQAKLSILLEAATRKATGDSQP
jgi:hypothetical protein